MVSRSGVRSTIAHVQGIDEPVRITRSPRRVRTVAARRKDGVFELLIPASMSAKDSHVWARKMYAKYSSPGVSRGTSDGDLYQRAITLRDRYVPEAPPPAHIRWVRNQRTRWGSCSSATRSIRLSHHLQGMPQYVIDSVLIHEIAHLVHPDHGPQFRAIEARFERLSEAQAFLAGAAFAQERAERRARAQG